MLAAKDRRGPLDVEKDEVLVADVDDRAADERRHLLAENLLLATDHDLILADVRLLRVLAPARVPFRLPAAALTIGLLAA